MIYKEIYNGLKINVTPLFNDFKKEKLKIEKNKKKIIFDKDISLEFNRKLSLFEIDVNNDKLNLIENYEFMNYFFNDDLTLKEDKKILLRRMLLGLISYYPIDRSSIVMPTILNQNRLLRNTKTIQ